MDIYHTIVRPLVTEKGTHQSQQSHEATRTRPARGGAYAFEVHLDANKTQIRQAVQELFKVKVTSVNTMMVHGKARRQRTHQAGKSPDWKKAVVTLKEGDKIVLT